MAQKQGQQQTAVAKKEVVDQVESRVNQLTSKGELQLPPNYSAANALKSAWLKLQEIKTSNGKPALEACTRTSIQNALFDMVIQGMDPSRDQGYLIPYGQQLVFQRSAYGDLALAKRQGNIKEATPEVVFEGDEFEFRKDNGRTIVDKHKSTLKNRKNPVEGAYCTLYFHDGSTDTEVMDIDEIKAAWKQGQVYKGDDSKDTVHTKFTAEMAKKTVLSRAVKRYIRSADDSHLFTEAVERAEEVRADHQAEEEIAEEANQGAVIDVEAQEVEQSEPAPEEETLEEGFEKYEQEQQGQQNIDPEAGF